MDWKNMLYARARENSERFKIFLLWVLLGCLIGVAVGIAGGIFHLALEYVTAFRAGHPRILWALPFAGLVIVFSYRLLHMEKDGGTNFVLVAVRERKEMSGKTAPLIFISTLLTHLCGGSAGREGAALQLGASIASQVGKMVRLNEKDERIIIMCGMSAGFAALFGTTATSVVFAMEVVMVGVMYYAAIVPCTISAILGAEISARMGNHATAFSLPAIASGVSLDVIAKVMLLAMLCAALSVFFCGVMEGVSGLYKKYLPKPYARVFCGGCIVILFTYLVGCYDYNGAGMDIIRRAIAGEAKPEAFLLKILLTALTLGAGFKGGEIVPTFFIGATFGCTLGNILQLPPGFAAAIGMGALFCAVTNCPLTSIILYVELFGVEGLGYYILACAISYMLSGYRSLYREQRILYSKFKIEYTEKEAPRKTEG